MDKPKNVRNLILQKPLVAIGASAVILIQAVLNVSEVVVLEQFINVCSDFKWGMAVAFAMVIAGMYAFRYIQVPLLDYLNGKMRLQMREYLDEVIICQMAQVSAASLEQPESQALIARLQDEPERRYTNAFFAILQIVGGILSAAGVYTLIAETVPFFLLITILLLGMMIVAFRLIGKNKVALYQARKEISRRSDYLSEVLFERRLAQERKLFSYTEYVQREYEEENIKSGKKLLKSIFISNLILWFYDNITYLFSASAYLLFLIPLYKGEIHIGLYVAIIPALTRLGAFFVEVGSKHLPTYKEYRACQKDLLELYAFPKQYYDYEKLDGKLPEFQVMSGRNIVFRYPGEEKPIINGLNFDFHLGKNYALVGENGCGKTTLIKLLLGIYKPECGSILIDGKDISEMEYGQVQRFFSAVFQDFNRYDYSIRENITFSAMGEDREEEIRGAAGQAEMDEWIQNCPKQYDTFLGKLEEEGIDLSGGQWQRLSIARMLYRKARVYIWDEPTAAMDPLAESRLYSAFLKKRSNECVNIFITHRLGAAVNADEICVMEKGRFVEKGSHKELMEKVDGLYRRMFQAQRGMYE